MALNNNRQSQQPDAEHTAIADQRITDPGYAQANGAADQESSAEPAPEASNVERAEQIADHLAEKCAAVTSACVRQLAWLTARAREAAEDLWAEAQSVRRKE
jgi:hypothetical protein